MIKELFISTHITESPEMDLDYIFSPLINEEDNATVRRGRMAFSIGGAGSIEYPCGKKKMLTPLSRCKKSI